MIIQPNKISIDFNDTDYAKGLGVSVQNAKEGSISSMGIEYTRDCTVQKDMEKGIVYTESGASSIIEETMQNLPEERFDPADFISQSMTGEDAKDIEEEGSILEEYVASSLERAIERVKSQRRDNAEALENQVEKSEEKQEFSEEMERRIQEAAQMASGIQGMSEAVAKYFLENGMNFTPADVKTSSAVTSIRTYMVEKAPFEEMKQQVEAILEKAGQPVTEEKIQAAQWLYEQDLPVTMEKIENYEILQELSQLPTEAMEDRIRDDVRDGQVPENADLTKVSYKEAKDRVDTLVNADEQALATAYPVEAERITARRQLEEIRLRMTIDAARIMEKNGIRVELDNLVEIVEQLKQMEQEACRTWLAEAGLPDREENIEIAGRTLQAGADILTAPVAVLGRTIGTAEQTIEGLATEGNTLRIQMEALAEQYETVGTEVRTDLGDSIKKAFGNVTGILQDLELAPTAANQRAVRILAYNQMALTKESVLSMKEYDAKVTTLAKNLKPEVVTELIRRQENPLEMSVEELSEKVATISDEIQAEDISFRKYLWKLDHSGAITPEGRKSMIGIYRLLDKVEKSDGAVIGQVVKEGRELSFASLLSAVRTRKAEGLDQTIDDDFGGLTGTAQKGERISEQIRAAFGEHVVSNLRKELSPAVMQSKGDSIMTESLEELWDECIMTPQAQQEEATYYEALAAEIRQMASQSEEMVLTCLRELDLPETMVNIQMMKGYLEQGSKTFLGRYSKADSEKLVDAMADPEELEGVFDELDEKHSAELTARKESPEVTHATYKELAQMASSISFYRQMRQYHKYEIPIVTERGVTACSVTVVQGTQVEKGTVEIAMESERFGSLRATYKVNGDKVSGFVTTETADVRTKFQHVLDGFETDLEMNGLHMEREDFATGKRHSFRLDKETEGATNSKLYQVAKLFIQNVQKGEDIV